MKKNHLSKNSLVQLIEINDEGIIEFSDNYIFNWSKGCSLQKKNALFSILDSIRESNILEKKKEFKIPAINFTYKDKSIICDVIFRKDGCRTFVMIYDKTTLYTREEITKNSREFYKSKEKHLVLEKNILEESKDFKEELIHNVNHELAGPMTSIKGFLGLLRKTEIDDYQRELIDSLLSQGEYLELLLSDMTNISLIQTKGVKFKIDVYDFKTLYEKIISSYSQLIISKGKKFNTFFDPKIKKMVRGDQIRLYQIFNILVNHIVERDLVKTVSFKCIKDSGKAGKQQISVIISGITLIEVKTEKIPEILSIQEKENLVDLNGDIAIVDSLTKDMNMEFSVGKTLFNELYFLINFEHKIVLDSTEKEISKKSYVLDSDKKYKVLVIENQENIQFLLLKILISKKQFLIDVVSTAEDGISMLEKREYDLVICDIKLPEMSGLKFAKDIRRNYSDKFLKDIPILGISGSDKKNIMTKVISSGMDAFLSKPFSEEQLMDKVTRLLSLKR